MISPDKNLHSKAIEAAIQEWCSRMCWVPISDVHPETQKRWRNAMEAAVYGYHHTVEGAKK